MLRIARSARNDAVRWCRVTLQLTGVPTIKAQDQLRLQGKPATENCTLQQSVSIFRLAPMLLQLHTICDTPHPPNRQELKGTAISAQDVLCSCDSRI